MSKVENLEQFYDKVHANIINSVNSDMYQYLDDTQDMALYTEKKNIALEATFNATKAILGSISCKDCQESAIKSFIRQLESMLIKKVKG